MLNFAGQSRFAFFSKIGMNSSLADRLRALREDANFTLEQLAAATKIQKRYLENLESGEFDKLPPAVYVKGFVQKWAQMCGADSDEVLLQFYRENKFIARANVEANIKNIKVPLFIITAKHIAGAAGFVGFIIMAVFFYFNQIAATDKARIEILKPLEFNTVQHDDTIYLEARVENADRIFINDKEIQSPAEILQHDYLLEDGLNTIIIRAENGRGSVEAIRKVLRVVE